MTHYRAYPVDRSGHIVKPPTILSFDDDAAAIEQAKRLVDGHDIEVWDGKRLVIYLSKNDASSSENSGDIDHSSAQRSAKCCLFGTTKLLFHFSAAWLDQFDLGYGQVGCILVL